MRLTYRGAETVRTNAVADTMLNERETADEKRKLIGRLRGARWTRPSRRRRGLSEMHRVRLTAHEGPAW